MATYSNRMALIKPAGSEARSNVQLNTNADLLDKFMPCILVNDGVTPPTGDLYDGALVKERTSGIIWEARKNGGGTYDKVYVRYPYSLKAVTAYVTPSVPNALSYNQWGVTTWVSGKNSSVADLPSGKIQIPVKGIYSLRYQYRFDANATGVRGGVLNFNGTDDLPNTEVVITGTGSGAGIVVMQQHHVYSAGDLIVGKALQNSGGALGLYTVANLALIEPIQ